MITTMSDIVAVLSCYGLWQFSSCTLYSPYVNNMKISSTYLEENIPLEQLYKGPGHPSIVYAKCDGKKKGP